MNVKSISNRLTGKLSRLIMLITLLGVIFSVVPAHKVAAFYSESYSGQPGYATLPVIQVSDEWIATSAVPGMGLTVFTGTSKPVIYRSPSYAGGQWIKLVAVLQKYDSVHSEWINVDLRYEEIFVSSAYQRAAFTSPYFERDDPRGYWRVSWILYWFNEKGGLIASNTLVSNQTYEYKVVTIKRWWQIYPGHVRLGGYMNNSW
jgi:hypothetical protein